MKIMGGGKKKVNVEKKEECCCEGNDCNKIIEEKDAKIEEQKNQMLRLMADFDNYKKRALADREEIICFSNEVLILELLPIIDSFERAMSHALSKKHSAEAEEMIKGFALIKKQLEDMLAKTGLKAIESTGKEFDPNLHEAVLAKEAEGIEDGMVLEEMQKGYKLKEKVIRPSMVIVSKKGGN